MSVCKYCGVTAPDGTDICRNCDMLLKIADSNIDSQAPANTPQTESPASHGTSEMLAAAEAAIKTDPKSDKSPEKAEKLKETLSGSQDHIRAAEENNPAAVKEPKADAAKTQNTAEDIIVTDNINISAAAEVHELAHLTTIDIKTDENEKSAEAAKAETTSHTDVLSDESEALAALAELSDTLDAEIAGYHENKEKSFPEIQERSKAHGSADAPAAENASSDEKTSAENDTEVKNDITEHTENSAYIPCEDTSSNISSAPGAPQKADTSKHTAGPSGSEAASDEGQDTPNTPEKESENVSSDETANSGEDGHIAEEKTGDEADSLSELPPEVLEAVAAVLGKGITDQPEKINRSEIPEKERQDAVKAKKSKLPGTIKTAIKKIAKTVTAAGKTVSAVLRKAKRSVISAAASAAGMISRAVKFLSDRKIIKSAEKIIKKLLALTAKAAIKTARFFMGTKYSDGMFTESEIKDNSLMACISYFPLMFPIPSILRPKSRYLRYHSICGAAETLCMAAVIFSQRLLCRVFRSIFTVTVNAESSFEHTALSRTGLSLISASELLSYTVIFIIFVSCIAMPIFGRKHSLAPDIFYKLAASACTRESENSPGGGQVCQPAEKKHIDKIRQTSGKTNDTDKNKPQGSNN